MLEKLLEVISKIIIVINISVVIVSGKKLFFAFFRRLKPAFNINNAIQHFIPSKAY